MALIAFVILHGLIAAHLVLWYGYGWRGLGAIDMQELFRQTIENSILTVGALFFLVFIGLGLLWGRFFCGWLCHIGQVYDLISVLYEKLNIKTRFFPLRFGPLMASFILIYYFAWEAFANRTREPPPPLSADWNLTAPWELLPGWLNGSLTLGLILFVLPLFLGKRAFCKNLCPWGVLFGAAHRISPLKVRRTGDCTLCGHCSTACPMDIDVARQINRVHKVPDLACTNCFQCVAACPTDALSFSLPSQENRQPQTRPLLEPLERVPLKTELCFWALTLSVGLTYSELYGIGIFMAYSLGMLLAWLSLHLILTSSTRRRSGTNFRKRGAFCLILLCWLVVTKDGLAHYYFNRANQAWLNQNIAKAQSYYEASDTLLWQSPNILFYRLYTIYKSTNQEAKRKTIYARYELRRTHQKRASQ